LPSRPPEAGPAARPAPARSTGSRPAAAGSPSRQPPALADRPVRASGQIQITTIDVGSVEMGRGIETQDTTIVTPLAVATGELASLFPEPIAMPSIDTSSLSMSLGDQNMPEMPAPPPIPVIKWADMIPSLPAVPTIEEAPGERKSP
jgi:hypothetical protein